MGAGEGMPFAQRMGECLLKQQHLGRPSRVSYHHHYGPDQGLHMI